MNGSNHNLVRSRRRSDFREAAREPTNGCFRKGHWRGQLVEVLLGKRPVRRSRTCCEGPFGEVIRTTGPLAKTNPFRFSTKYQDDETDLLYYGYRYYKASTGRWVGRDPIGELGGENLYGFVENDPLDFVDFNGLTTVKKHAWSITQQQAMNGIWGWTDLESQEEKPAKLKMKKKLCFCVVTKKPEMVFTISVQTTRSGKQSWKESAVFDGVTYPDTSVYVGSGLASFSQQHEEKRFQAWKTALTSFWPAHYEDPAANLTAPTCDELKAKIDALRQQAATEWKTSAEGRELIRRLIEIGQEGASVSRWVRKSGFGSVRVVYDTN
jgi:RHS repeat-associated protein